MKAAATKMKDCPTCDGSGNVDGNPCPTCDGEGEIKAAEAKPCGCGLRAAEGADMDKNARIAALIASPHNTVKDRKTLEALTDETLKALEVHVEKAVTAETEMKALHAKVTETETALRTAQAAQIPAEELVSLRTLAAEQKQQNDAEKADLVKALSATKVLTEAQLVAKTLTELRELASFAKIDAPVQEQGQVSYVGRGLPIRRVASETTTRTLESFTPPDPYKLKDLQAAHAAATK
jgi:hypothetical protein